MGYNKYLWDATPKENCETFGVLKVAPIDETKSQVYETFIHYGAGHKCEIAAKFPDDVVSKALYLFDISYFRIERIYYTDGLTPADGILVETKRVINRQIGLYGHSRFYLVKQLNF